MKGRKILMFSRDPGGTNAVMPLIEPLRANGNEVFVYGKDAALPLYQRLKIDCKDIRDDVPLENQGEIREFVRRVGPDLIVTGTSSEDFTERHLWLAAKDAGMSSFAVLDQWTNYRLRLIPDGERPDQEAGDRNSLIVPSVLFVMDEFAKEEMAGLGIDRERLVVSGQPFFDYIRKSGGRFGAQEIETLRRELSGDNTSLMFVFASQPMTSIHRQNGMAEDHWGYTENTILQSLTACLAKLTKELAIIVTLVIRLHPKDEPDAYRDILASCSETINVVFDRETDSSLLLKAADLTIGMFSMILLEAAILARPFISVQIGLKREDPLILDRLGVSHSILSEAELEKSLRRILTGETPAVPKLTFEFGATERIVEYLERYQ